MVIARRVFLCCEDAAVQWFAAKYVEVIESDNGARHDFRIAVAGQCKLTGLVSSETFKRLRPIAVLRKQSIAQIEVAQAFRWRRVPERHQAIGFF